MATYTDIAELKQLEQQLRQAQKIEGKRPSLSINKKI
jgi:hypothetical protein